MLQEIETERAQVESRLKEAIYHPTVDEFFRQYDSLGCLEEYCNFIGRLSKPARSMLVDTNATQVHKEKSVIPLLVARNYGFDPSRAVRVGVATEAMWGLSTVADDILDNDLVRNEQPSMWAQHGLEATNQYFSEILNAIFEYLDSSVGRDAFLLAKGYVQEGLESIGRHKRMDLATSPDEILCNYAERDGFHTFLPIQTLGNWENGGLSECAKSLMLGMSLFNQAGQVANDTSDMRSKNGIARFSDMREGRVTIAIATLYSLVSGSDRAQVEQLFGSQREYSLYERSVLAEMIEKSVFVPQMTRRIVDTYERSRAVLQQHFLPQDFSLVEAWIAYKTEKYV